MSGSLVVRPKGSARRRGVLAVSAVLALATLGWGLFELGAWHAGLERTAITRERRAIGRELAELRRANQSLRERITLLETSRDIDRQAYREVELSLADLQSEIQAREEELQFYRGILSPEDRPPGLRVERAEIRPQAQGGTFSLRLLLVQALRQNTRLEGELRLSLRGRSGGEEQVVDLAQWLSDATRSVDFEFSFRYFQELEWEFRLPDGFVPERLQVELVPGGQGAGPVSLGLDWPAEGTS
jgi:hypothetical protein